MYTILTERATKMKGKKRKWIMTAVMTLCLVAGFTKTGVVHADPTSTTVASYEIGHIHGAKSAVNSQGYASISGGCYTKAESYSDEQPCGGFTGDPWEGTDGKYYVTCKKCGWFWVVASDAGIQQCSHKTTVSGTHYGLSCTLAEGTCIGKINVTMNVEDYICTIKPSFEDIEVNGKSYVTDVTYEWDNGDSPARTIAGNGTYTLTVSYKDNGIAQSKVIDVSVTDYDNEIPVVTNAFASPGIITNGDVTITVTATDNTAIGSYRLGASGSWQDSNILTVSKNGTYPVYARDIYGNISEAYPVTISNIDKIGPAITVNIPDYYSNTGITVDYSATDNTSSADTIRYAVSTSSTLTASQITGTDKSYTCTENGTYYVYAKDEAGNVSKKAFIISKIDTESPVITIEPIDRSWTNGSVTISYSATDNSNDTIYYAVSKNDSLEAQQIVGTLTSYDVTENGTYYVYAKDLAGNVSKRPVEISNIDKDAPVIMLNEYDKNYVNDTLSISVTITDNSNGTILTAISMISNLTAADVTGTETTFTILDNGTYYVYAKDEAGNVGKLKVNITNFDKEPPRFTFSQINNGSYPNADGKIWTKNVKVTVSATDNVALHEKAYRYEASAEYIPENDHVYTTNGSYRITVRDAVGNETSKDITIDNIDQNAPVIAEIYKQCKTENGEIKTVNASDTEPKSTLITLNIEAMDNESGINGLRYRKDNGEYTDWQSSLFVPDLKFNGTYTIEVRDKCGNTASSSVTITNLLEQTYVTYQDVTNEGKVLGEKKILKTFNSSISGAEMGIDTKTGAYYEGYDYVSCDTAIVTDEKTIVHRFFKLHNYKVKYYDTDGKLITEKDVPHGGSSNIGQTPKKSDKEDGDYIISYEFIGWGDINGNLISLTNVRSDMSVYPVFKEIRHQNLFTVTFIANGKVISTQKVKGGESAVAPDAPDLDGCIFKMWDKKFTNVRSNITIQAIYTKKAFGENTDKENVITIPPVDHSDFDITALSKDVKYIVQSYEKPAEETIDEYETVEQKEFDFTTVQTQKPTFIQQVKDLYTNEETKTVAITTTAVVGTVGAGALAAYIVYAVAGVSILQLLAFTFALVFKKRRYIKGAWMTDEEYVQYVDKFGRKLETGYDENGNIVFSRKGKPVSGTDVTKLLVEMQHGKLSYAEFEEAVKASNVYTSFNKDLEIEVSNVKAHSGNSSKAKGFSLTKMIKNAMDIAGDYKVRIYNGSKQILFDLKFDGSM